MSVIEQSIEYIKSYLYKDEIKDFLQNNTMLHIMHNSIVDFGLVDFDELTPKDILRNRVRFAVAKYELEFINNLFVSNNIKVTYFKGITLASLLYNPFYIRCTGDIDVFVETCDIDRASELLVSNNYKVENEIGLHNPHHIPFIHNGFKIELHRNIFHPILNINEQYIRTHIKNIQVGDITYNTFDETATLLHLVYHLYMHAALEYVNVKNKEIYFTQNFNTFLNRWFFRIFEIALYVESYKTVINWNDFLSEICKCRWYDSMFEIFYDINIIYQGVFPDEVLNRILKLKYDEILPKQVFSEYYDYKFANSNPNISSILKHVVSDTWDSGITIWCPRERDNHYYEVDEYQINKINKHGTYLFRGTLPDSPSDISFKFSLWQNNNTLKIHICVIDDVIVMDNDRKHDYLFSDCVCVNLVTVGKVYRQSPIYGFIRKQENELFLDVYDIVHSGKILDTIIDSNVSLTDDGYEIMLSIPLEYIKFNPDLDEHFYMDIMVYDCDNANEGTKTILSVSTMPSELYNPQGYIKVQLHHK